MKRSSYLLSFLLFALTFLTACPNPDDDAPTPEPGEEETQNLTGGTWTVNDVTLNPSAEHSVDGTVTISFQENNTYTISGAAELPNPTAAPNDNMPASGTWAWANTTNYNAINLTSGGTTVPLTITTLSETALTFTYAGAVPKPDDNVTVTVSATR